MTHQDPCNWPQPDHRPRHAGPARRLPPPFQRALRLLVAAGIAAACLCLIIGAVALVAAAGPGAKSRGATVTPAAHQSATLRSDQAGAGRPPGARPALLLSRAGHGSETTSRFRVGRAGTWQLSWSYHDCRSTGRKAAFDLTDGIATGVGLTGSGPAGHGVTWTYADPGWHQLIIRSGCAWTIRVAGPH